MKMSIYEKFNVIFESAITQHSLVQNYPINSHKNGLNFKRLMLIKHTCDQSHSHKKKKKNAQITTSTSKVIGVAIAPSISLRHQSRIARSHLLEAAVATSAGPEIENRLSNYFSFIPPFRATRSSRAQQ